MNSSFPKAVARHLGRRGIKGENETNLYLFSLVAAGFCLISHLLLFAIFVANGVRFYIVINIGSICIYSLALLCHQKRAYTAVVFLITLEVIAYATIFAVFSGISSYIVGYYLVISVLHTIMPYAPGSLRHPTSVAALAIGVCVAVLSLYIEPTVILSERLNLQLTIINIVLMFLDIITLLYLGQVIHRVIDRIHRLKMHELSALANTDPLTGLFNRRYASTVFSRIANENNETSFCVAILDIDEFKEVNDAYGHACGDEVLVALSKIICDHLREEDLAFRWGGEEFLIILKGADLAAAYSQMEKLRISLSETIIETKAAPCCITATVGVTALDPANIEGSIKTCDDNMYIGKNLKKNTVIAK